MHNDMNLTTGRHPVTKHCANSISFDIIGQTKCGWRVIKCARVNHITRTSLVCEVVHVCGIKRKMVYKEWLLGRTLCPQCRPSPARLSYIMEV